IRRRRASGKCLCLIVQTVTCFLCLFASIDSCRKWHQLRTASIFKKCLLHHQSNIWTYRFVNSLFVVLKCLVLFETYLRLSELLSWCCYYFKFNVLLYIKFSNQYFTDIKKNIDES